MGKYASLLVRVNHSLQMYKLFSIVRNKATKEAL